MASDDINFPSVWRVALHRQVTRAQLAELGLDGHGIARRDWLYPVHRGVHSVGGPPRTGLEYAAAALLACGDGAALCHGSAMTLWGMWKRWQLPIHVAVPGDRRPSRVKTHKLRGLAAADICTHRELRVTSPARTLLDMAPYMAEAALKRRVNEARRAEILTLPDVADVVERFSRHPGARRLRPLLEIRGGPTRSEWEDAFPAFCRQYDLPDPILSEMVAGYEADALFPNERVVVELDSWDFHKDREAFESDRDRDADRLAAGFVTIRITWERIKYRSAREAARLHRILRLQRTRAAWTRGSPAAPGALRRAPSRPSR
jgi:hypothetical protein